jgi:hypothetical protein
VEKIHDEAQRPLLSREGGLLPPNYPIVELGIPPLEILKPEIVDPLETEVVPR